VTDGIIKSLFAIAAVAVPLTILAASCGPTLASSPRANCYTCVERCHPFRVSACEPSWSHVAPLYCSCDPFTRVDEPPATIGPAKGK
jgi:hypothetical protein